MRGKPDPANGKIVKYIQWVLQSRVQTMRYELVFRGSNSEPVAQLQPGHKRECNRNERTPYPSQGVQFDSFSRIDE